MKNTARAKRRYQAEVKKAYAAKVIKQHSLHVPGEDIDAKVVRQFNNLCTSSDYIHGHARRNHGETLAERSFSQANPLTETTETDSLG